MDSPRCRLSTTTAEAIRISVAIDRTLKRLSTKTLTILFLWSLFAPSSSRLVISDPTTMCSLSIISSVSSVACPIGIWDTLERKLGDTTTDHARLALVVKFADTKPKDVEPFEDYFAKLIDIRNNFTGHLMLLRMPSSRHKLCDSYFAIGS
ncbi:hypothetical protein FPQ18DRAFT_407674 [Pyronema domesticum]|nr:hypothetical protein FPQ18DRAFT_407674 [Pyronema domesticum]